MSELRQVPPAPLPPPGRSLRSVATRVRSTSPADFLRMVVTAIAVFTLLQSTIYFVGAEEWENFTWVTFLFILVGCVAMGVSVWAPVMGMFVGFVPQALTPVFHEYGVDILVFIVSMLAVVPVAPRWAVAVVSVFYLAWIPPRALMLPAAYQLSAGLQIFGLYLLLLAIGLAARFVFVSRERTAARIAHLEEQALRIHSRERDELARELHDVVAHQLSIASLQVMGHRDSEDVEELRGALDKIDDATRSALSELRLLVGVLRSHDDGGVSRQFTSLAEQTRPSAAAAALAADLREGGFRVTEEVSEAADALDVSLRRTVCRILQESATNALRHARRGGACELCVEVQDDGVRVTVASDLDTRRRAAWREDGDEDGFGLLGLRERVELTGGTFQAGEREGRWVVEAVLPRA